MGQVIWVDENDNALGIVTREKAHGEKLLHRIAIVYVVRDDGQILIQERLSHKLDHSAAGHVEPGEDYKMAAKRELKEELGMDAELTLIGKINTTIANAEGAEKAGHISEVFITKDGPMNVNYDEVRGVFWADPKEIWADMQTDKNFKKYTGGFKVSLKFYLEYTRLI